MKKTATSLSAIKPAHLSNQAFAVNDHFVTTTLPALLAIVCLSGISDAAIEFQDPIVLESPNAQANGWFGAEGVDWVSDVNDDGIVDIVVSAPGENPDGSPSEAGRVYVFDGVTREVLTELRSPNEVVEGNFGWKIAGIEDLNGNDSGDVVVATSHENRAYVLDGRTGEIIHTISIDADSVSAVPDVNNDGLDDFVVGSYINPNTLGYVRIYDGASGALLRTINAPAGNFNFFGWAVSGVPDVNGDGGGDVVVGNWGYDGQKGRAYVYDGATGLLHRTLNAPFGFGIVYSSPQFGRAVVGLEDITGDGRGDVVIGAASGDGRVYIFDGATGAWRKTLSPPEEDNATPQFGWVVNPVPDVTGDGLMDVIVRGSPETAPPHNAYLFDGTTGTYLVTLSGNADFGGGGSMTGIPDINGDGRGEVLVANWTATSSTGHINAGHVLLYLSAPHSVLPSLQVGGMDGPSFKVMIEATAGSTVEISATSDFVTWESVTNIVADGDPIEINDPAASIHPQRFYRAVQSDD